ncbi:RDD family protein [Luteimonas sp. e5]
MATPPADPVQAAGLWPRAVAWLLDAGLLLVCAVLLCAPCLPPRWLAVDAAWSGLAQAMVRQMVALAASPAQDFASLLAEMRAASAPLLEALTQLRTRLWSLLAAPLGLFLLLAAVVWPWLESRVGGATLGKRALGLHVVDDTGARLSFARALARHLAGALSWLSLNIGHLLALSGPDHRALHDRLAGTRVVWRADARQRTPAWGVLVLVIAGLLPVLLALAAGASLTQRMDAVVDAMFAEAS